MTLSKEIILDALRRVKDPELGKDLVTLNMITNIAVEGDRVKLGVELTTPACPMKDQISKDINREVKAIGASAVEIDWSAQVRATPKLSTQLPGVKNIVAALARSANRYNCCSLMWFVPKLQSAAPYPNSLVDDPLSTPLASSRL